MADTYTTTHRIYLTESDEAVLEGHPDARWLYAIAGAEIPAAAAEKYGLAELEASAPEAPAEPESEDADGDAEGDGEPSEDASEAPAPDEAPAEPESDPAPKKKASSKASTKKAGK